VQAHGGRFEVTSPGRGSCFDVCLPVEAEALDPVPTRESL
jgi:signal transduction histidine kinase